MNKLLILFFLAVLTSCQSSKNHVADAYNNLPANWKAKQKSGGDVNNWLKDFDDKLLVGLVDEAIKNNYNLQASAARLEEAWSTASIAGADRLWQLSLDGTAQRQRSGSGLNRTHSNSYSLFARFSWEIDVWGKLKDRVKAAEADLLSEYFTFRGARLSLAASVTRFWFNAVEARLQLLLAEETEQSFLKTYEIIDDRFNNGLSEALDVRLAEVDVANARQNKQQRKADFDAAVRALEVLLGRYPAGELKISENLPAIIKDVPLGLPAELLNRRPDILSSLQSLTAAGLRVSEKKKELLPGISLTASAGNTSDELERIFNAEKILWSLAGNLTQPLLQGGRIRGQISRAKAREKRQVAELMQLVYDACLEVETALGAEKFLNEKETQIANAADFANKAFELARDRYSKGLTDIITLLASQRAEFTNRSRLLEVKLQRLLNRLNLYLALGGEFNEIDANSESMDK